MKQSGTATLGYKIDKKTGKLAKSSGKALTLTQRMAKRARDKKPKYGRARG